MPFPHINGSALISHPLTATTFSNEPSMGLGLPPWQQGWLCGPQHVVPPATPPPNSTLLSTKVTKSSGLAERERNKEI